MSPLYALVPFVVIALSVISILAVQEWKNNKKLLSNLKEVAFVTNGSIKQEDGFFILEGKYNGRAFSIYFKPRGMGKNKALYYHLHFESDSDARLVSVKKYVQSRLEAKINEMHHVTTGDEDFDAINRIMFDNENLGKRLLSNTEIVEIFKKIMQKYTEMSIKKDITLLKRYHVSLTEPKNLLDTLDHLIKIAQEVESLSKELITQ